jgi:perosamine synthetase
MDSETKIINQIQPWINEKEKIQLDRVVRSTFLTEASLTKEFEELTKKLTKAKYAITITNGTLALYCCLKALGIGPGDEVIVPNITFIASANAVIMAGGKPVFCEVEEKTYCIDIEWAERLISSRTKAIMPVHLYGLSADMMKVKEFANCHNIKIIEDAAQGVGVKFNNQHVGTFGDCGVLSYYGNKTITCGEGGMILTNNEDFAKKIYRLKNHGRDQKGTFIHEHIGFNFSFTEMQAAIGIAQMHKLPKIIQKKQKINQRYLTELKLNSDMKHSYIDDRCKPVYWFTSVLVQNATVIEDELKKVGIQTRRFFYPLHLQPCYKKTLDIVHKYPISEKIYNKGLSLPSSYQLTNKDQSKVISKWNNLICLK